MSRPRILLLEDDALISTLVSFAVDDMAIELVSCTTVAQAQEQLALGGVSLFLSDLMLPGESGLSFLQRYPQLPGYDPLTKVAVFSAGLSTAVRDELKQLGVWRLISKPASIGELRACVEDALAAPNPECESAPAAGTGAVDIYFEGDAGLFDAFKDACRLQFPHDIAQGDSAWQERDFPEVRRLAHSLKTVLLTIDQPGHSAVAASLERAAAAGDAQGVMADWALLRAGLAGLCAAAAQPPARR